MINLLVVDVAVAVAAVDLVLVREFFRVDDLVVVVDDDETPLR